MCHTNIKILTIPFKVQIQTNFYHLTSLEFDAPKLAFACLAIIFAKIHLQNCIFDLSIIFYFRQKILFMSLGIEHGVPLFSGLTFPWFSLFTWLDIF